MRLFRMLRRRGDEGIAMMTAILVGAVLLAVCGSVLAVSTSNLVNSGRDRNGVIALATSESGVAQAIEYLTVNGVAGINCYPTTCPTGAWTPGNPQTVTVSSGRTYTVSITPIQPYSPPTYRTGQYLIDSVGKSATGLGVRHVIEKVSVAPFNFPVGVFAQQIDAAGSGGIHKEMVFSNGCITNRNSMKFPGNDTTVDPYYGLPPAVYSTGVITNDNNSNSCVQSSDIHASSPCNLTGDATHGYEAFDRDQYGGNLNGTTCYTKSTAYGTFSSSFMSSNILNSDPFNYNFSQRPAGLTPSEYAALRFKAQQQGNYWTPTTIANYTPPCAVAPCANGRTAYPNTVVYFDMNGGTIDNQIKNIVGYEQSQCGSRSVIVVVRNADVSLQSTNVTGALFAPEGTVRFNSNTIWEGTIFAKGFDKFNGTGDIYLDPCWVQNTPGGLINTRILDYHEDDRH